MVLDIIGGESSKALHGIQGVVGDGEPTVVEESEPVPPSADGTFILDLSPITEEQPGSSLVEPPVTGAQKRDLRCPLPNNDAYELLLKRETKRPEAQILLAEEQVKLAELQPTRAKLQICLLKTGLENAGLSYSDEEP